ncbi:phosphatidylglycerol lysyltransferase domain-containing protein [Pseudonocardia sp. H11422]|uniref:phosphatidylglycerol lysyltransferase domain-containing protein n=1 Tax=Pseudonocardia sp. H11422 TaxID=2835866 RepID=UPI0020289F1E
MLIRRHGGLSFGQLRDRTGAIQLVVDRHRVFDALDRGDWVGVEGTVMTTRRGELSVRVTTFTLLAKALVPAPDKHAGLSDVETRYRQRYLDLEVNERTREIFRVRPLVVRHPHTSTDWEHAERLVHSYGWDSLAYFALRDDKNFLFAADGEAMIAYTYLNGYALVSGDPIGAPASVTRVVDEFLAMCVERAWNPAFLAVRESDRSFYAARGFRSFYLGDEAIMRCDTFSIDGPAHTILRAAVRRVGRRYRFALITESQASPRWSPSSTRSARSGAARRPSAGSPCR